MEQEQILGSVPSRAAPLPADASNTISSTMAWQLAAIV